MRKLKMSVIVSCTLVLLSFVLMSFVQEKKPWDIPAKYQSMKNPQAADDAEMIKIGKMNYSRHCKSCHGNIGQGNGPKARSLDADLGDFTSAEFQASKDGVIYYQSFIGRDEMPNFEKKIPDDEDRWAIVTYIRTLKK
ncbi:c-type cytochrome [Carboxylicivirga sp. A043]|uniref:c-type cytochrome n=1 Tax=Carboxylicivirga litoralis TaxID=2816963 RepID=UPI0021CB7BB0|nr:c-type cytochrome [Carboxylicivirga sp. A043]MCU4155408.1 c-type cytochrome [Carboxylicivirga sp. A043]